MFQYFLQREWSSRSNQGKATLSAPGAPLRANHRASISAASGTSRCGGPPANPSDQEVEVCVATLPYVRGRSIPTPNLPKSATTWGPLHKPLIWKVSLAMHLPCCLLHLPFFNLDITLACIFSTHSYLSSAAQLELCTCQCPQ